MKPFKVKIIRYAKRVSGMHDLAKYLPPPLMKGKRSEADNWTVRNQEITTSGTRLAIKDRLPSSMRDELENHPEDYRSSTYEDWSDLLSKMEVKCERKRAAFHIKKTASDRSASLSESDESIIIPSKKKARTGVLHSNKT